MIYYPRFKVNFRYFLVGSNLPDVARYVESLPELNAFFGDTMRREDITRFIGMVEQSTRAEIPKDLIDFILMDPDREKHWNDFEKSKASLRFWLRGRGYDKALDAMEWAGGIHVGLRKDGITPEFAHQVRIVHYLRTLESDLIFPQATLSSGFLHDAPEDYDLSFEEIQRRQGELVADAVRLVTKVYRGKKDDEQEHFEDMARHPVSSILKGGDRVNNFQTMVGVFKPKKQVLYIEEGERLIMPMLKTARRLFPEQEKAYENVQTLLRSQIELIRAMHPEHCIAM